MAYNRVIRKLVVAFGDLFNDISLMRYNPDGSEAHRQKVPIVYSSRERYVMRLQGDPDLDKKVQITLPRMSFEMNGLSYDATRKQQTNVKNFARSTIADNLLSQYNPVPYDFNFSLYLYVRNIEDGTQIIEHILPYFTPDYTLKLNLIPEMGIVKEVPVILKNTDYEISYEGDRDQETRTIIWTLNFTVKGFVYGPVSESKIIKTSFTNIFDDTLAGQYYLDLDLTSGGVGDYQEGEYVYQGYSYDNATASGRVILWNNSTLKLRVSDMNGNFVSTKPIHGVRTGSQYLIQSGTLAPVQLVEIKVTPNPSTANANSNYTYNVDISEFPFAGRNGYSMDSTKVTMDNTTITMDNDNIY